MAGPHEEVNRDTGRVIVDGVAYWMLASKELQSLLRTYQSTLTLGERINLLKIETALAQIWTQLTPQEKADVIAAQNAER
jgi:hypothetical protein